MKTRKNTNKTTITSLISDMNRWYGPNWYLSGLAMLGVFAGSVIIPGIFG